MDCIHELEISIIASGRPSRRKARQLTDFAVTAPMRSNTAYFRCPQLIVGPLSLH